MITSVISSAARLSLAPARLAGRVAGSLLRELRGDGDGDAGPARSSARSKPAARTSANGRRKRDAAVARAKEQPKRGAGGTRTKAQPKRPATRTRAGARPKPEPKPLDDVTIARKVESTIFRGIDVDKGKVDVNVAERVVWLRGEVASQDAIKELGARATEVTEVRRVENLLHVPEAPAPGRTDTAAVGAAHSTEDASPPVSGAGVVEAGNGDVAEVDQDAQGDESSEQDPGVVGLGKDSAYQSSGTGQRGPGAD